MSRTLASEMHHPGMGIEDYVSTGLAHCPAEINFLEVEEVSLIEKTDVIENLFPDQKICSDNPSHPARMGMIPPGEINPAKEARLRKAGGQPCNYE